MCLRKHESLWVVGPEIGYFQVGEEEIELNEEREELIIIDPQLLLR